MLKVYKSTIIKISFLRHVKTIIAFYYNIILFFSIFLTFSLPILLKLSNVILVFKIAFGVYKN